MQKEKQENDDNDDDDDDDGVGQWQQWLKENRSKGKEEWRNKKKMWTNIMCVGQYHSEHSWTAAKRRPSTAAAMKRIRWNEHDMIFLSSFFFFLFSYLFLFRSLFFLRALFPFFCVRKYTFYWAFCIYCADWSVCFMHTIEMEWWFDIYEIRYKCIIFVLFFCNRLVVLSFGWLFRFYCWFRLVYLSLSLRRFVWNPPVRRRKNELEMILPLVNSAGECTNALVELT